MRSIEPGIPTLLNEIPGLVLTHHPGMTSMGLTTWRYPSSWVGLTEHFFDAERAQQVERGVFDGDGSGRGFRGFTGQYLLPQSCHSGAMRSIEPGIQGFPDVQLHILSLVLTQHPGMTSMGLTTSRYPSWSADPANSRSIVPYRHLRRWH